MVLYIIAMRDIRANVFSHPELWPKTEQAVRAFEDRCNNGDTKDLVSRHPQDFELVVIGEFEDNTGTILEYKEPDRRQICVGKARQ